HHRRRCVRHRWPPRVVSGCSPKRSHRTRSGGNPLPQKRLPPVIFRPALRLRVMLHFQRPALATSPAMRYLGIAMLTIFLALSASGCDSARQAQSDPPTVDQLCSGLKWPHPMPAVVGLIFQGPYDQLRPLTCLDNVRGVARDGTTVYTV